MIILGITGGYATGKTIVGKMFKELGAKVISADRIAHGLMKPFSPAWQKVVRHFGKIILRKDGLINRQRLACIIFSNPVDREKLNQLTHPLIIKEIKRIIKITGERGRKKVVAVDVPLLFEAGMEKLFNKIIVVSTNHEVQYRRAWENRNLREAQISRRINSQWPLERKIKLADFVIDNNGTREETRGQVEKIFNSLKF